MRWICKTLLVTLSMVVMGQSLRAANSSDTLQSLKDQIDKVESVEQIDQAVTALTELSKSLDDSAQRREAATLKGHYSKLYEAVKIERVSGEIGREEIRFTLNDRVITTNQKPAIDGGKARDLIFVVAESANPKSYQLTYDYYNCRRGKESVITMTFNVGAKKLQHKITFDVDAFLPNVKVEGNVTMKADVREEDVVDEEYKDESEVDDDDTDDNDVVRKAIVGIRIEIPLQLIKCQRLKINSVQFSVPGVVGTFGMSNLAEEFEQCESCVVSIQFPDRVEIDPDVFNDYNRPSTLQIRGMMNERVPLNESFDVNVLTDW